MDVLGFTVNSIDFLVKTWAGLQLTFICHTLLLFHCQYFVILFHFVIIIVFQNLPWFCWSHIGLFHIVVSFCTIFLLQEVVSYFCMWLCRCAAFSHSRFASLSLQTWLCQPRVCKGAEKYWVYFSQGQERNTRVAISTSIYNAVTML